MEIIKKLLFSRKALLTLLLLLFVGAGTIIHIFTSDQFISFAEFTLGLYCGANVLAAKLMRSPKNAAVKERDSES